MPAVLSQPFAWGSSDCAHLMAASVRACHGDDHPALAMLTRYSDERSARRLLRRQGGLAAAIARHFEEVPVLLAQTGDIGVVVRDGVEAGMVIMEGQAVGKAEHSPHYRVPLRTLSRTFRV